MLIPKKCIKLIYVDWWLQIIAYNIGKKNLMKKGKRMWEICLLIKGSGLDGILKRPNICRVIVGQTTPKSCLDLYVRVKNDRKIRRSISSIWTCILLWKEDYQISDINSKPDNFCGWRGIWPQLEVSSKHLSLINSSIYTSCVLHLNYPFVGIQPPKSL